MEKGREIEGRKRGEKGRGREKWSGERERNRGKKLEREGRTGGGERNGVEKGREIEGRN